MCSLSLKGEVLHWKGGTWSHVGPLAASRPSAFTRDMLVTWGQSTWLSLGAGQPQPQPQPDPNLEPKWAVTSTAAQSQA